MVAIKPIATGEPRRFERRSAASLNCRKANMTAIPIAKPTMAGPGAEWSTPGTSSIAAAANTTPAAKCCTALVTCSPGVRMVTTSPENAAAATGIKVKSSASRYMFEFG
ncbi:hypothetical protein ACS8YF_13775 [Salinisphaera sp. SWV1]|uniref:hypothetical protein n=1 Tax=Salinisphaera sp. SWV1 TaxID=3454139 RepID=UPI003F8570FA